MFTDQEYAIAARITASINKKLKPIIEAKDETSMVGE